MQNIQSPWYIHTQFDRVWHLRCWQLDLCRRAKFYRPGHSTLVFFLVKYGNQMCVFYLRAVLTHCFVSTIFAISPAAALPPLLPSCGASFRQQESAQDSWGLTQWLQTSSTSSRGRCLRSRWKEFMGGEVQRHLYRQELRLFYAVCTQRHKLHPKIWGNIQ